MEIHRNELLRRDVTTSNTGRRSQITEIHKSEWTKFCNDFSKRRFGWFTRVEIVNTADGDRVLADGLVLNGIVHADIAGRCSIEISLGDETGRHHTHSVAEPRRISYQSETSSTVGVLELVQADGTRTLLSLLKPIPVIYGYTHLEMMRWP